MGNFKWASSFSNHPQDILAVHISCFNLREVPIEGTPLEYQQLYQKCCDGDPELRPDIEEVYEILSQLYTKDSFDLQSQQPYMHNFDTNKNNLNVSDNYNFCIPDNLNLNSRDQLVEGGGN
ncbi:unnamed protein product [Rhizophagus irregularis]|nr:unnamed protein product [Rhizophagus irregularis]